jgi:nucleoid DNA-binding protein
VPVNKTGLVNEVKTQLGVSTAKARSLVDTVFEEMAAAVRHGDAITLRGFEFTPESDEPAAADGAKPQARKTASTARAADSTGDETGTDAAAGSSRPRKNAASRGRASKEAASTSRPRKDVASPARPRKRPAPAAPARTATGSSPTAVNPPAAPQEPQVVPYEPLRDPVEDALAAVAAEQSRPEPAADPIGESPRVISTMPEPELQAAPDTLAYSSGEADTDESIGELTGSRSGGAEG